MRTLDLLGPALPAPDLIKIDVEGAELLALRGAERWWASLPKKPVVFFEQVPKAAACFGYDAAEVQRWFRDRGMEIYAIREGALEPVAGIYEGYGNLLAIA